METSFIYDCPASGKRFIGRKKDLSLLENLIAGRENIVLYGKPKEGRISIIREVLSRMGMHGTSVTVANSSFRKARTAEEILISFASGVIKSFATSEAQIKAIAQEHLAGSHFVFDAERYAAHGEVLSSNWVLDETDYEKVFSLPIKLAAEKRVRTVIVITDFQSILFSDECDSMLRVLDKIVALHDRQCSFIFCGSRLNAMKEIFETRRFFHRSAEHFILSPFEPTEISEYVNRGFQNMGKVIEKNLIIQASESLGNGMWYTNQLFSIIDGQTRGFVNSNEIAKGMKQLLAIHTPRFYSTICSLTDFQLNLLRAISDGVTRFSSSSVIDHYRLNSSANVKRLKDALCKKEVIGFDDNDDPFIQDDLFAYWLSKEYFAE